MDKTTPPTINFCNDLHYLLSSISLSWLEDRVKCHLKNIKNCVACWGVLIICGTNDISEVLFIKSIMTVGCWSSGSCGDVHQSGPLDNVVSGQHGIRPRITLSELSPNVGDHAWVIIRISQELPFSSAA